MADGKPSAQTDGTKRKALDISTKRVILNELAQGAKNCELVKKYGVSKSTISTILKNKDKIISADANSTDRKHLRRATYADVEEALLKWFIDARARNIPISGPMMLAKARDFAFLLYFPDFCSGNGWLHRFKVRHGNVFKSIVAVDRPAANLPLRVSLYSALEMVKASWAEVTATCVQNCFRKAGFADVEPDADPEASEEDHSGGDLWQRVVDSDMGGRDICWDDFVTANADADTAEPCTDEALSMKCAARYVTADAIKVEPCSPPTSPPPGSQYVDIKGPYELPVLLPRIVSVTTLRSGADTPGGRDISGSGRRVPKRSRKRPPKKPRSDDGSRNECDVCGHHFVDPSYMEAHRLTHTDEKQYPCSICGRNFSHARNLKKHNLRKHAGVKHYTCPFCDRQFTCKPQLVRHKLVHMSAMLYACRMCACKFFKKATLDRHEQLHASGADMCHCSKCGMAFEEMRALQRHLEWHCGREALRVPSVSGPVRREAPPGDSRGDARARQALQVPHVREGVLRVREPREARPPDARRG
ncbi:hypothetical protein HPB50_005812 [Hyalomma asiaticum]|uniref:Uncharacterized protein n=1 Tax=Hyalomma asiaticum TaxID=266040 RepID=A0ACB7RPK5_HYAAI|nr:hypothetical protein HPB50_005812 [Hyalomma asiaticum]